MFDEDLYCSLAYQLANLHVPVYYYCDYQCCYTLQTQFEYVAIRDVDWNDYIWTLDCSNINYNNPRYRPYETSQQFYAHVVAMALKTDGKDPISNTV
jgi:hypothetical protein